MKAAVRIAILVVFVPVSAGAQTNERLYEGLDFRFVTPGARAVGMGITFVGLADDATAAASNPAGLSNLQRPELSFETIRAAVTQTYLVASKVPPPPCAGPCQVFQSFDDNNWVVPSFASFVAPAGKWSFAAFINSEQEVDQSFSLNPRSYAAVDSPIGPLPKFGQTAEDGHLAVSIRNYGFGSAWVARPWLSLGGSLVVTHMRLDSVGINAPGSNTPQNPTCPHSPDRSETDTSASVTRPSLIGGVLIKPMSRLSIGAAYYHRTIFPMQTLVCGTFATATEINGGHAYDNLRTDYVVPGRLSFGASYRIPPGFTIVGEVARVLYSQQLTENFQVVDFGFDSLSGLTRANYYYDDVNEYHVGVEYRLNAGSHVIAFRGGAFTSPAHSLKFVPTKNVEDQTAEYYQFDLNPPNQDRIGKTLGGGLTFFNNLQLDVAFSWLSGSNVFVVSLVKRFL
jgi:long-subunit fatty acid transport protein